MHFKNKEIWLSVFFLTLTVLVNGCTKCVKFNSISPSTKWGTPAGHSSGDVVYTEDDIDVSVHDFGTTGSSLGETRVGPSFMTSGEQAINTRAINLGFDFSKLNFTPTKVEVLFWDTGGSENISINENPIIQGELASGSAPGVTWSVSDSPQPNNPANRLGTLTINGNIQMVKIGGQEFWIESVCAKKN
jgi:hypothetical protein